MDRLFQKNWISQGVYAEYAIVYAKNKEDKSDIRIFIVNMENDDLEQTLKKLIAVLTAERLKRERQTGLGNSELERPPLENRRHFELEQKPIGCKVTSSLAQILDQNNPAPAWQ